VFALSDGLWVYWTLAVRLSTVWLGSSQLDDYAPVSSERDGSSVSPHAADLAELAVQCPEHIGKRTHHHLV